jgi:hypothetical protein
VPHALNLVIPPYRVMGTVEVCIEGEGMQEPKDPEDTGLSRVRVISAFTRWTDTTRHNLRKLVSLSDCGTNVVVVNKVGDELGAFLRDIDPQGGITIVGGQLNDGYLTWAARPGAPRADEWTVCLHDDDSWEGRPGATPRVSTEISQTCYWVPTLVSIDSADVVVGIREAGAAAAELHGDSPSDRLTAMRTHPFPTFFALSSPHVWTIWSAFVRDRPVQLPHYDWQLNDLNAIYASPLPHNHFRYLRDSTSWSSPKAVRRQLHHYYALADLPPECAQIDGLLRDLHSLALLEYCWDLDRDTLQRVASVLLALLFPKPKVRARILHSVARCAPPAQEWLYRQHFTSRNLSKLGQLKDLISHREQVTDLDSVLRLVLPAIAVDFPELEASGVVGALHADLLQLQRRLGGRL